MRGRLALLLLAGLSVQCSRGPELCDACRRPLHANSKTVAYFGDHRAVFCCPACALTTRHQSGRPVRITRLTDFNTDTPLVPADALLVRGSDVNLCEHRHVVLDESKRQTDQQFDRCSPSILAFSDRAEALQFMAAHGGRLMTLRELQ